MSIDRFAALSALALALAPAPAGAYTILSGDDLHEICQGTFETEQGAISATFCAGFIRGAFEQFWRQEIAIGHRPDQCLPADISNRQIVDLVKAYVGAETTRRDVPAMMLVQAALERAFPGCFAG